MQTHLFKPLPRRIIMASSLYLCLLALPAAAQNFAVPEIARPPVKKPLPPEKTKPQKNLETENQVLKRQLGQARKEADAAKAAKAQAAHVAAPPAVGVGGAGVVAEKPTELEGFVLLPGGVARDKKTGLEWMRCSLGQTWDGNTCQGEVKKFTFGEAQQAAKDLNAQGGFDGKTNWRVPTVFELFGLVVCSKGIGRFDTKVEGQTLEHGCLGDYASPAIAKRVFLNMQYSKFWSSSPNASYADSAWSVAFNSGYLNDYSFSNSFAVRLVRYVGLMR